MKQNPFDLLGMFTKAKNPFRELSKEERKEQLRREQEVKEGIKQLGEICNDIVLDQRYSAFANLFKDIEKKVIDLMIDFEEKDRDKFYLQICEMQIKLRMFRQILKIPREFIERAEDIKRTEVK